MRHCSGGGASGGRSGSGGDSAYRIGSDSEKRRADAGRARDAHTAAEQRRRAVGIAATQARFPSRAPAADPRTWTNSSKIRSWSSGAMPMPVSATQNSTPLSSFVRMRSRRSPALGELQRVGNEVAQDLRDLGLVRDRAAECRPASSNTQRDDVVLTSSGRSMPRKRAEQFRHAELAGAYHGLARLDLRARSSRSLTRSDRSSAALRMKATCRSCSAVRSPSTRSRSSRDSARIEFSGVRNSWLMLDRKRDFISSARRR